MAANEAEAIPFPKEETIQACRVLVSYLKSTDKEYQLKAAKILCDKHDHRYCLFVYQNSSPTKEEGIKLLKRACASEEESVPRACEILKEVSSADQ